MNKVAVITGCSSGIGQALAVEFGKQGYCISGQGRNAERILDTEKLLSSLGIRHKLFTGDVGAEADCKELIEGTVREFGGIDIMICNAGVSMRALFGKVPLKAIETLMQTNFWGTVYCAHYALPHLLERKGSLVGVSSVAGYIGLPGRSGYSASKFAMHGLLETIRNENRKKGLHVLLLCPGFTASNIRQTAIGPQGTPQGESPRDEAKMMQPEEVARECIKAIYKRKRFLVLTSQGKLTWLLKKFFPSFVDAQVYKHMAKEKDSLFS
jgi:dehydrogenase/reductase SDR family member 7B